VNALVAVGAGLLGYVVARVRGPGAALAATNIHLIRLQGELVLVQERLRNISEYVSKINLRVTELENK
jgi:uncharacterized membrane protein